MPRLTIETRDMEMVALVAESGGLRGAATSLNVTPSALSHQLSLLEQRLGAALFQRAKRRMLLTPAGERLLRAGIPLLRELRRAEEDIAQIGRDGRGVLRVSTESYTSYHWLPSVLGQFERVCPGVEVQVKADLTNDPLDGLRSGALDLAIVHRTLSDASLRFFPLFQDEVVIVVPVEHSLAPRTFVEPSVLASEHLLVYPIPRERNLVFTDLLVPGGVVPAAISQVPLTELMLEMVHAGLGVAVLSRWACGPAVDRGDVRALRIGRAGMYRGWYAAHRDESSTPAYVHAFIELLFRQPIRVRQRRST